jgi:4'-phosphopantetheinyl transferase
LDRAARFIFDKDRNHFVAARAILREILGRYLHVSPGTLEFEYGARRKPAVSREHHNTDLRFNISHSNGLAVFAFARGRELGVDVEWIRPSFATREIAERYFSPRELAEWRELPAQNQSEGFFLCWTRKEAYVKARGEGLYIPLQEFDVSLTPGRLETLRSVDSDRWTLSSLDPGHGCAGAVVVERRECKQSQWEYERKEHVAGISNANQTDE